MLDDRVRNRLEQLSRRLGNADWLGGGFSAGDLLMVTVLRRLEGSGLLDDHPNLSAYVARGKARPALQACFRCSVGGVHRRIGRLTEGLRRLDRRPP